MGLNETVEWRVCPDYPNYLVSNDGQVRRILRDRLRRCGNLGRILKPGTADGYFNVVLIVEGQRLTRGVHRLVALTFLGPPPSVRHQAAHWDGNRRNNQVTNLRWATGSENMADQLRHGTLHKRSWNSKLNETDIERVRDQACCGVMQRQIAQQFGVQQAHISKVVRGLKWRQHLVGHGASP